MLGVANALVSSIACSGPDDGQDVRRTWGERMSARVGRLVVRGVRFVRRTSCPSPLESEFDTVSRLRFGVPAVAYGSAVNEETGCRRRRVGVDRGRDPPLCPTDILSVASTSNASPRGEPCSTTKVTGRTKVAAICVPRRTRSTRRAGGARRYQGMNRWLSSFSLRALRVLRGCSNRVW